MGAVELRKERTGGWFGEGFCKAPHPTNGEVWCRRFPHDEETPHAAFAFSISELEEW